MRKQVIRKAYRFDTETEAMLTANMQHMEKMSESEYIRDLIRRDHTEHLGISASDLIVMKRQLIGIGTNINQIAHHINAGDYYMASPEALEQALDEVADIKKWIDGLMTPSVGKGDSKRNGG